MTTGSNGRDEVKGGTTVRPEEQGGRCTFRPRPVSKRTVGVEELQNEWKR